VAAAQPNHIAKEREQMNVLTVEYFKTEFLSEDENRLRLAMFVGFTNSFVRAVHLTKAERLSNLENLVKAWEEINQK
jgi:hypothetical protein